MLYDILGKLDIDYKEIEHEAVFTVDDVKNININIEGYGCKNLFLKDNSNYYLVIIPEDERANLKELRSILNSGKLSFSTEEELSNILKLERGSCTPFGIINDINHKVTLVISHLLSDKVLLFHPNVNTRTLSIKYSDLIKFIEYYKNNYIIF